MEIRIIKTDEQYRLYLSEVEKLAGDDPDPTTPAGSRLELLAKLVEDYEKSRFIFQSPDPVDAILFRMEQEGLRQKDIADLLGGKNRASEILARKRPLTLPMIRELHDKLHIPSNLLIREPSSEYRVGGSTVSEEDLPLDLLVKRGLVSASETASRVISRLDRLFAPPGSPAFLKSTLTFGTSARTNKTNLWLWLAFVRERAAAMDGISGRFRKEELNEEFIRYIAKLSWMDRGPQRAREFLHERGIALVILQHLPKTHLDGAALLGIEGAPIIGLTLREDRLDNFWFTLIHELVHAWKHLDGVKHRAIVDENIESPDADPGSIEKEANDRAAEILLPKAEWRRSEAYRNPSSHSISLLAKKLQISPAIVAGRIRYERKNYALFSKLVGYKQVRMAFPDLTWDKRYA